VGTALEPERYDLVGWTFLRLLGAIYLAAFTSLGVQIQGLVGSAESCPGRLPRCRAPGARQRRVSDPADAVLAERERYRVGRGTVVGAVLGLLVILDWWTRPALIGAFVLYLSCVVAGQEFMSFQWDACCSKSAFSRSSSPADRGS
jgi:hypothetical protein